MGWSVATGAPSYGKKKRLPGAEGPPEGKTSLRTLSFGGDIHWGVALPKIIAVGGKVSKVRPHISTTKMTPSKNSTDLGMGRCPELKSVEFFEGVILVAEIFTILCLKPLKKCYTIREHDPDRLSQTPSKVV